jgi:hypothetical protein
MENMNPLFSRSTTVKYDILLIESVEGVFHKAQEI